MEFAIIYNEGEAIRLHEYCNRFYILSNANMTKKNNNVETTENVEAEATENNEAETTKPEETKQDFAKNVETKPIWKVKVIAKYNRWSFNKGQEYEITKTVLENYDGLFEVL